MKDLAYRHRGSGWRLALCGGLVAAATGCAPSSYIGYSETYGSGPSRSGVDIGVASPLEGDDTFVVFSHLRTRHFDTTNQPSFHRASLGVHVAYAPLNASFSPLLHGGLSVASFEAHGDEFAFGMGSPFVEGGMVLNLGKLLGPKRNKMVVSVLVGTEYQIRLTSQKNTAVWSMSVGLMLF